jgi:hypothetical protein
MVCTSGCIRGGELRLYDMCLYTPLPKARRKQHKKLKLELGVKKKSISGKDVSVYEEAATQRKPQKTCQTKRRRPVFAS